MAAIQYDALQNQLSVNNDSATLQRISKMGWLWNSSASQAQRDSLQPNDSTPQPPPFLSPTDPSNATLYPSPSTPNPPSPQDSSPQDSSSSTSPSTFTADEPSSSSSDLPHSRTRDQIANDEVINFFRNLEAERKRAAEALQAAEDDEDDDDDDADEDSPELLTPTRLYDTKARCMGLFDMAYGCASPGGQIDLQAFAREFQNGEFFNVYRYGTLRQCGHLFGDVMWCMRTNRSLISEREREERTMRRMWQRERERLKERGGCAEEVWGEGRRWVEKNAFKADWEGEESPFSKKDGGGL